MNNQTEKIWFRLGVEVEIDKSIYDEIYSAMDEYINSETKECCVMNTIKWLSSSAIKSAIMNGNCKVSGDSYIPARDYTEYEDEIELNLDGIRIFGQGEKTYDRLQ